MSNASANAKHANHLALDLSAKGQLSTYPGQTFADLDSRPDRIHRGLVDLVTPLHHAKLLSQICNNHAAAQNLLVSTSVAILTGTPLTLQLPGVRLCLCALQEDPCAVRYQSPRIIVFIFAHWDQSRLPNS